MWMILLEKDPEQLGNKARGQIYHPGEAGGRFVTCVHLPKANIMLLAAENPQDLKDDSFI